MEAFAGSTRHVFDYLAEEVLSRQPEDVREFLLKTSVVETLSGPLCEALTDTADGQGMLERLERENLFLVPLDEEGRYYRYHHLFAAFLRERLRARTSGRGLRLAPPRRALVRGTMGAYPGLSSTPWPRRTSSGRLT